MVEGTSETRSRLRMRVRDLEQVIDEPEARELLSPSMAASTVPSQLGAHARAEERPPLS